MFPTAELRGVRLECGERHVGSFTAVLCWWERPRLFGWRSKDLFPVAHGGITPQAHVTDRRIVFELTEAPSKAEAVFAPAVLDRTAPNGCGVPVGAGGRTVGGRVSATQALAEHGYLEIRYSRLEALQVLSGHGTVFPVWRDGPRLRQPVFAPFDRSDGSRFTRAIAMKPRGCRLLGLVSEFGVATRTVHAVHAEDEAP